MISIIHPSYGRPEMAIQTARNWISRAKNPVEYIMCYSFPDPLQKKYWEYINEDKRIQPMQWYYANMVEQMNAAAKQSTGDLIVSISDDFDCPDNWDRLLIEGVEGKKDFVVRIDDGVRNPNIDSKGIIPLPIMDRIFYERLGHIYNPEYNHFYGDEELFRIGLMLGKKIELPIVFNHVHYVTGKAKKDAVNVKNNKFHEADKQTFNRREAEGFELQRLSILIPTLKKRDNSLNKLINYLQDQIDKLKANKVVEIIKFTDNGERSIGEKRNRLVNASTSDYIAFIDDDDSVPNNYVQLLLSAIQDNPDCCSLNGILTMNGKQKTFKHSIIYNGWYEKDNVLYRFPNHLNCVKKSIAKEIHFPEISRGEDRQYSDLMQKSGLLKTEATIEQPLYFYNYTKK